MSIEQPNMIDLIGIDNKTGNVILTIIDPLMWDDTLRHLEAMQAKINSYIRFFESEKIYSEYPQAKGKQIVFRVVSRFAPDTEGLQFFIKVEEVLKSINVGFERIIL